MATEYDTEAALVTFRCGGVDPDLFLVSRWSGEEGVSQPYRFDIELASPEDNLDLNRLLGSRATLAVRTDAGAISQWHGIVTELKQLRRDETYAHYRAVLEPQLALLRLFRQSRVYVHDDGPSGGKPDLSSVIRVVLAQCGLTQEGEPSPGSSPHFSIRVPDADIKATQSSFMCQFEETSLDFLSRRLEHEGVYYWFEQGDTQETVVFANDREQQPSKGIATVWRPDGELNPEADVIAVNRFDHTVSVQPRGVVLRDFSVSQPSLDLTVKADIGNQAPSPDRFDALGSIEVYGSNYKKQQRGERLASVRADEIACQRSQYLVQTRAIGVSAGRHIVLQQHFRQDFNARYYVIHAQHEGNQSLPRLTSAEADDGSFYSGLFTVLPHDVQFRPSRRTVKPRVVGFVSAIVVAEGDGEYAQMNEYGCYRVRFLFAPPGSGQQDNANSAWVRMATPYAGDRHGMNFPLLKGTEVLVSFLSGDPDRPVIVSAVPNEENPSIRTQDNATQPGLRTAGQNALEFEDRKGKESVRLLSPADNSVIHMGTDPVNPNQSGIRLATNAHVGMTGRSYIQDVPGIYHQEIGRTGEVDKSELPRLTAQALQDAQMARLLEEEALLPNATPALQVKALGKKLVASTVALRLREEGLKQAQQAKPIDQDVVNSLEKEIVAAKKAESKLAGLIEKVGNKEITAKEALDQVPSAETEADGEDQKKIVNVATYGLTNTFRGGLDSILRAGGWNTGVMGLATVMHLGKSIAVTVGSKSTFTAAPGFEFAFSEKSRTSKVYLTKSLREKAKVLKRETKAAIDTLQVGELEQFVQAKYLCATNGPYAVRGTGPLATVEFSTFGNTASVNLETKKATVRAADVVHLLVDSLAAMKLEMGRASVFAVQEVKIKSEANVVIQGQGQATMNGNVIRIG